MEPQDVAVHDQLVLAETPQPSGSLVFLILLVLLAVVVVHLAAVILGSVWAWRAGRGSQPSLVGFVLIGSFESLYLLGTLSSVVQGEPNLYLGWVAVPLLAQIVLYIASRRTRAPGR